MLYKMLTLLAMLTTFAGMAPTSHAPVRSQPARAGEKVAEVEVFAPENGHRAGIGSQGWFIDLEAEFDLPLERTGFSGLQLTGPGVHTNVAPMPGTFSKGADDRFPGLIVLLSTTQTQRADGTPTGFSGPGQNLANLFNLTGVTDRTKRSTELWATWIVGAPLFGRNTASTAYVAIAADRDHDGIYEDAPDTVPDADRDGDVDEQDLNAYGVASNTETIDFFIQD